MCMHACCGCCRAEHMAVEDGAGGTAEEEQQQQQVEEDEAEQEEQRGQATPQLEQQAVNAPEVAAAAQQPAAELEGS